MNVRDKHYELIRSEIKSMREWLDFLERDLDHDKGVISAVIIQSVSESCMKITYNAGVANGAVLSSYDDKAASACVKGGDRGD